MDRPVRSKETFEALRGLGIRLAVDDYGTGYSSLAYLRELAVDELKLDKSFVIPMLANPDAAAIVRSTIDLAHALGLRMVARASRARSTSRSWRGSAVTWRRGTTSAGPSPPRSSTSGGARRRRRPPRRPTRPGSLLAEEASGRGVQPPGRSGGRCAGLAAAR
jgi:predicted signal transduction protein with EAL and GGDEF domain